MTAPQPPDEGDSERIAVVVGTFNGGPYVAEQLDSIARQRRLPDLVVISDDGSTDETLEIANSFASAAPFRVEIRRRPSPRPRAGNVKDAIAATFARGLAAAADADLVAFADQDDIWFPSKLNDTSVALKENPSRSFAFSDAYLMDAEGHRVGGLLTDRWPLPPRWNERSAADQLGFALRHPFATGATMVVRTELLRAALPIPTGWLHDRWVSVIGSALGGSVAIRQPTMGYRVHSEQAWGLAVEQESSPAMRWMTAAWSVPTRLYRLRQVQRRLSTVQAEAAVRRQVQVRTVLRTLLTESSLA